MSLLAAAIEEENWELAALCLLYALAQALAQLPPDAIEGVMDALAPNTTKGKHRGRKQA